jgi:hypothetical protein
MNAEEIVFLLKRSVVSFIASEYFRFVRSIPVYPTLIFNYLSLLLISVYLLVDLVVAYNAITATTPFPWLKIASRPYEPQRYEISAEEMLENERITMALAFQLQQHVDRAAAGAEVMTRRGLPRLTENEIFRRGVAIACEHGSCIREAISKCLQCNRQLCQLCSTPHSQHASWIWKTVDGVVEPLPTTAATVAVARVNTCCGC